MLSSGEEEGCFADDRNTVSEIYQYFRGDSRAGVRHVRGVRPNRAADFRGPPTYSALHPDLPPPVKLTSLHNRLGVLKCSKTHLQQLEFQKISGGQTPEPPLLDTPSNTMNRAANCLTPALGDRNRPMTRVLKAVKAISLCSYRYLDSRPEVVGTVNRRTADHRTICPV